MVEHIERRSSTINDPLENLGGTKPSLPFDSETGSVVVNGIRKGLSPTDYRLLIALIDGKGRVISREDLRSLLVEPGRPPASDDSLRFYIRRLKGKLQNPEGYQFIKNVHGVGYKFNMAPSEEDRTEEVHYYINGRIYYPKRRMIEIDGEEVYFNRIENILFWLLVENLGKAVSKQELTDEAWSKDTDSNVESLLKKYIQRIRRKIKDQKIKGENNFTLLRTVYGEGYKLVDSLADV